MSGPRETPRQARKGLHSRVAGLLATLRPMIQGDGGDIELIDVDLNGVVKVRLLGACVGCPSSVQTLSIGIEQTLKSQIPEITRVECG